MKIQYDGPPCYHPGSGLDLAPGELEVSEEQAAQLGGLVRRVEEVAPLRRKRGLEPQDKE